MLEKVEVSIDQWENKETEFERRMEIAKENTWNINRNEQEMENQSERWWRAKSSIACALNQNIFVHSLLRK